MTSRSVEALVEESVFKLKAISERRNVLLREMHQMIHRAHNLGSVLSYNPGNEEDLQVFLQRFEITKENVENGSITTLGIEELSALLAHDDTDAPIPVPTNELPSFAIRSLTKQCTVESSPVEAESNETSYSHLRLLLAPPNKSNTSEVHIGQSRQPLSTRTPDSSQNFDDGEDELDLLRITPLAHKAPHFHTSSAPNAEFISFDSINSPRIDHLSAPMQLRDVQQVQAASTIQQYQESMGDISEQSRNLEPLGELLQVGVDTPTADHQETQILFALDTTQAAVVTQGGRTDEASVIMDYTLSSPLDWVKPGTTTPERLFPVTTVSAKKPVIVRATHLYAAQEPKFVFIEPPPPQVPSPAPIPPPQRRLHFKHDFTLPSLKTINSEYSRKSKSLKRRRDKDRDGSGSGGRKDEWAPLGLNKWAATISANPVWKKVARASKCLNSREWAVAMSELRLIRAIDRIESLKREGRWSFRQPKKQRMIGGMTKMHQDHLLDEMKWMRIDFREERKWKLTLAYNISTAVLDWHAAGSSEVRLAKGISVRWRRSYRDTPGKHITIAKDLNVLLNGGLAHTAELRVDPEQSRLQQTTSLLGVDYGSDEDENGEDEDDDAAKSSPSVMDALDPSRLIEDTLDSATELEVYDSQEIQPKTEDVDDASVLTDQNIAPHLTRNGNNMDFIVRDTDTTSGLKKTSDNPILTSRPTPSSNGGDTEFPSYASSKFGLKSSIYGPFREIIAYSEEDKLFLDLDEFDMSQFSAPSVNNSYEPLLPPPDLAVIFPDLQVFTLFDPAPMQSLLDGKRRSDKRSDRDDPTKRPDDILYTRLYPTNDFMMSKATLIGPLRPSRNWKNGEWLSMDEGAVTIDSDVSIKATDDSVSNLFDCRSTQSAITSMQLHAVLLRDKDNRKRTSDQLWNDTDDALLRSLIEKYPNNWALISECFNASRLTISTDKRTPRNCLDRWRDKWGLEARRSTEVSSAVECMTSPASSQMTTRGVKRLASANVLSAAPPGMTGNEPRKRHRHALVQETIRKAGKKRAEASQKSQIAQRKPPAIHETHAQYSKLPKRTPAELSRMKAEKEARDLAELQQARKRQEEINRQAMMNRMMVSGQGAPPVMLQQPQPQPQVATPMQRPVGAGLPPPSQVVPQIRSQVNISQQQRTTTPSTQTAGRLTQQQILVQVRAQQQQAQHALAQAQSQINSAVAVNGSLPANNAAHLSASYVTRDVTSSPAHVSPPHNSAVPSTVNSPQPPSAQVHPLQVPGNAGTRGGYYLPTVPTTVQGYTEQLHNVLRMQQQQQQQGQQALGGFPAVRDGRMSD